MSGSDNKFLKPSSSQSKTTQTRRSSFGSRKTCEPLLPCCFRFSAPFVENAFQKRSKSSIFDVARTISPPSLDVSWRYCDIAHAVSRDGVPLSMQRGKTAVEARGPGTHFEQRESWVLPSWLPTCPFERSGGQSKIQKTPR